MTIGRIFLAALALAASLAAISGCGSSPKPLTRAQLKTAADAICRRTTKELQSKTIKTQQDIARVVPELASFEQQALDDLSKLVPPNGLANDWKRFIAGAQALAENTTKIGEYAKENNLKGARGLIKQSTTIQRQMVAIAKRDGLNDCQQVA